LNGGAASKTTRLVRRILAVGGINGFSGSSDDPNSADLGKQRLTKSTKGNRSRDLLALIQPPKLGVISPNLRQICWTPKEFPVSNQ
jgi:hypothetical protein